MEDLLKEQHGEWLSLLNWDFGPSAGLVRRFIMAGTLSGFALIEAGRVVGYTYFMHEDRKGLIGDLYVMRRWRTPCNETALLGAAVKSLLEAPGVQRIESQLMMLSGESHVTIPFRSMSEVHRRDFMMLDLENLTALRPSRKGQRAVIHGWDSNRDLEAARVIAQAYTQHIDSEVNDQYRSVRGAQRFIQNIVRYPGCGAFYPPASLLAIDAYTGTACGVCLASILSPRVGHITQLCVTPAMRGKGLGYELMRRALLALAEGGCRKASLTVTAANRGAVRLYESVGFQVAHSFAAIIWTRGADQPDR
jgi:ribosomal protein S18 acetylase RimI-like enzyme